MKRLLLIFFALLSHQLSSQTPTIGLIHYDTQAYDGYLLLSPERYTSTYLINNCGQVVNEWVSSNRAIMSYLLENGNLLKSGQGIVELFDWDGSLLWSYDFRGNGYQIHHDIEPLPNGNFLAIIRDERSQADAIQAGRDPAITPQEIDLETIIEVSTVGSNQINIVWQWNFFDHLIQDFDATKDNYGIVGDHPELLDFNLDTASQVDWIHANGIDYNASLDQIVISSRSMNEIYIIDHSTTTAEAASHSGGNSGKGGDFLWRWGNPLMYRQGVAADQKLFSQHDANWIPSGYPNAGMISVFSNITAPSQSSIEVINPSIDTNGDYTFSGNVFAPVTSFWSWSGSVLGATMYSQRKGGTHALPNGNFMISEATTGRIIEITSGGTAVWVYENPVTTEVLTQNTDPISNFYFKANKYPNDYPGLIGKDLTPGGLIENQNNISTTCIPSLSINDPSNNLDGIQVFPNPFKSNLTITNLEHVEAHEIIIRDITGKLVFKTPNITNNTLLLPSSIESGIYFLEITDRSTGNKTIKKIIKY